MTTLKFFNKWSTEGISIEDPGIAPYITLEPRIVPRSQATYAGKRFYKSKVTIIERLINKLMVPGHKGKKHFKTSGHITGKALNATKIVLKTFQIIEKKLKENPIKILIKAIENAAPREEITTIEYGGARYAKAVECAPQRRVDLALRFMVQGAYHKCFNTRKKMHEALADEILAAYNLDGRSNAIAKKLELERQADASR